MSWLQRLFGGPKAPEAPALEETVPQEQDADIRLLVEAFLNQARDVAAWHRARIDAFERKAGVLLSAALVAFALMLTLIRPVLRFDAPPWFPGLLVAAAAALGVGAVASAVCMAVMRSTYVDATQLSDEWRKLVPGDEVDALEHDDEPELTPATALAISVQAMLGRPEPHASRFRLVRWWYRNRSLPVVESLLRVASFKADAYTIAVYASLVAVLLVGTVVVRLLLEGVIDG